VGLTACRTGTIHDHAPRFGCFCCWCWWFKGGGPVALDRILLARPPLQHLLRGFDLGLGRVIPAEEKDSSPAAISGRFIIADGRPKFKRNRGAFGHLQTTPCGGTRVHSAAPKAGMGAGQHLGGDTVLRTSTSCASGSALIALAGRYSQFFRP